MSCRGSALCLPLRFCCLGNRRKGRGNHKGCPYVQHPHDPLCLRHFPRERENPNIPLTPYALRRGKYPSILPILTIRVQTATRIPLTPYASEGGIDSSLHSE